jgi:molecular chaperone DnaK
VRESLTSEDAAEIRSRSDALQAAFQKVSEQIYSQAAQEQATTSSDGVSQNGAGDEEEVVDAEVVDDEKTS